MGHRGGYSYRLCKVKSKVWTIKEECFKAGHLQFYGNTTWQYLNPGPQNWDEANWEPRKLGLIPFITNITNLVAI